METTNLVTWKKNPSKSRPYIIAHRGAMTLAPQNTMAAFDLARLLGADGLEFDVQLSKDLVPMIFHDGSLNRLAGINGRVCDLSASELGKLDVGSSFSSRYAGTTMPQLSQVLESFGSSLLLNIELKSPALQYFGRGNVLNLLGADLALGKKKLPPWMKQNEEMVRVVGEMLIQHGKVHGSLDHILISSFDPVLLSMLQGRIPNLGMAHLVGPLCSISIKSSAEETCHRPKLQAIHPEYSLVSPKLISKATEKSRTINVWTVNSPRKALKLAKLGVHGIITNEPALLAQTFEWVHGKGQGKAQAKLNKTLDRAS